MSDAAATTDIFSLVASMEDLSVLAAVMQAAGIDQALNDGGTYTLFAPTNAAFDELLEELETNLDELMQNTDFLQQVLSYHAVSGVLYGANMSESSLTTMNGEEMDIYIEDGTVYLNDEAVITGYDMVATNGVVHAIDRVLAPPSFYLDEDDDDYLDDDEDEDEDGI